MILIHVVIFCIRDSCTSFLKKYIYTSLPNLLNIFCLKIIFFYMKIVLKGVRSVNTLECGGRAAPSNPAKKHKTAKKAYKKQKSMHLACFIAFLTTLIWTWNIRCWLELGTCWRIKFQEGIQISVAKDSLCKLMQNTKSKRVFCIGLE